MLLPWWARASNGSELCARGSCINMCACALRMILGNVRMHHASLVDRLHGLGSRNEVWMRATLALSLGYVAMPAQGHAPKVSKPMAGKEVGERDMRHATAEAKADANASFRSDTESQGRPARLKQATAHVPSAMSGSLKIKHTSGLSSPYHIKARWGHLEDEAFRVSAQLL